MIVNTLRKSKSRVFSQKMRVIVHTVLMDLVSTGWTISELAERSAVPITTLRMYQQRRLIDPPERRGRVGYYGDGHLRRLELIADLQARGYSLAAIADLLERRSTAIADVSSVEGLIGAAVPALSPERSITLTLPELLARLPSPDFSFEMIRRSEALDLVRIEGDRIHIPQPSFLEVGSSLVGMGVPGSIILDSYERLRAQLGEVAGDFAAMYDDHIADHDTAELPGDIAVAGARLESLARAAVEVVVAELRRALRAIADERLAERAQTSR